MSTRSEINDNQWTFTQGLILGQASFLLLTLVFIRYVVFSPANKRDGEDWRKRRDERVKVSARSTRCQLGEASLGRRSRSGRDRYVEEQQETDKNVESHASLQ